MTILNYTSSIAALPTSRNVQDYTATAAQTTFTVTNGYIVGLIDVYVNGSKLTASEFTATNGTTFVLTVASTVGDQVQSINYTASVNGISGAGTANYVPKFTASGTIGDSSIQDSGSALTFGLASTFSSSVNITTNGNPLFLNNSANTTSIGMKFTNGGGNSFIGLSNSGGTGYLSGSAYALNMQTESARDLQLGTNNATRMVITSTGIVNLYSPTTNADALNLYNSSGKLNIKMGGGGGSANQSSLSMYNASNTLTIGLNGAGDTDPSFITGYLAIGTTTNSGYRLYVSGAIYATGNITANSDLTLKKNLTIIDNPTDKLMQLNGYAYQWKSDDSHQYGVIAQEVEKILPYAVSTCTDGIKGVSYNQIIPVLIEAIKEQQSQIEELKTLLKA